MGLTTPQGPHQTLDVTGGPFFEDPELLSLQSRAMAYVTAGVGVHLRGPAGIGKTTLALRIADRLGRPTAFITGDKWLTRAELVGREVGYSAYSSVDNYINRVRRTESQVRADWQDAILTEAMRKGFTLIYDEFTRAPPQTNAVLLSVLEERFLVIHDPLAGQSRLEAHPEFRMILTSNPHDYVGVEHAPDALMDRLVTFDLEELSAETESGIVAVQTGLPQAEARGVVDFVRTLRALPSEGDEATLAALPSSIRTALLIGRLVASQGVQVSPDDPNFVQICVDVLRSRLAPGARSQAAFEAALRRAMDAIPRSQDLKAAS